MHTTTHARSLAGRLALHMEEGTGGLLHRPRFNWLYRAACRYADGGSVLPRGR